MGNQNKFYIKGKNSLSFRNAYPDAISEILTPENYDTFLLPD